MTPQPLDLSNRIYSLESRNPNFSSKSSTTTNDDLDPNYIKANSKSSCSVDLVNWGYPGYLTDREYNVYMKFRSEVYRRDSNFRNTVFPFGENTEEQSYALCRWLRARKFVLDETIQMVEEATKCRQEHARANFYENPKEALGVELSTYIAQYPQLYCGFTKMGFPLFISKPGLLCTSGLECITTVDGILRYHWHEMIYNFGGELRKSIRRNKSFKRFEVVCVLDLAHLSTKQVNKRALNIMKIQTSIDSLCFPETLHRLIVLNAPSFFSTTWKLISRWLDARTANKIDIYTCRSKAQRRLFEVVGENELPLDYGGKGVSTNQLLEREWLLKESNDLRRQISKPIKLRSSCQLSIDLHENETMKSSIFTRCLTGAKFQISTDTKQTVHKAIVVKHRGKGIDEEMPTRVNLEEGFVGPCTVRIGVESIGNSITAKNFLFVGKIYNSSALQAVKKHETTKKILNNDETSNELKYNQKRSLEKKSCNSSKINDSLQSQIHSTEQFKAPVPTLRKNSFPIIELFQDADHLIARSSEDKIVKNSQSILSSDSNQTCYPQSPLSFSSVNTPIDNNSLHIKKCPSPRIDIPNPMNASTSKHILEAAKTNLSHNYVMVEEDEVVGSRWSCGWKSCF